MASIKLKVNSKNYTIEADPKMPLLWAIRDLVGLTGTKYGCGIAQCGACTVHLGGTAVRSCSIPVSAAAGKDILTIEGLSVDNTHAVQQAWIQEQVPQCGYCQSGQIMSKK
jgi:isoquinoline 1-oxidoreductase subunit alpha